MSSHDKDWYLNEKKKKHEPRTEPDMWVKFYSKKDRSWGGDCRGNEGGLTINENLWENS